MFLYDVNLQNLTTKESRRNFLDLLNILNESDINLVPFHRQDIKLNNLVKIWPRKKVDRFQKVFKSRNWNDFLLLCLLSFAGSLRCCEKLLLFLKLSWFGSLFTVWPKAPIPFAQLVKKSPKSYWIWLLLTTNYGKYIDMIKILSRRMFQNN